MDKKKVFNFYVKPNNLNILSALPCAISDPPDAYILCKKYFKNDKNISFEQFIRNFFSYIKNTNLTGTKINFSFDEIINLKNNNIGFFVVSKNYIPKYLLEINGNINTKFVENQGKKILYFPNEYKFLSLNANNVEINPSINTNNEINSFHQVNQNQNNNFQINIPNNNSDLNQINFNNNFNNFFNNNNNIVQDNSNNIIIENNNSNYNFDNNNNNFEQFNNPSNINVSSQNDEKSKIIKILILLYGNEILIANYLAQGNAMNPNSKNLKDFFIINKSLIDKFKEIYHYDMIKNVLSTKGISNFTQILNNISSYESLEEIKSVSYMINIDTTSLAQFNITPTTKSCGEYGEYTFPVNFVVVHKSIIDLLQNLNMSYFIAQSYELKIGVSSLCVRGTYDTKKIFIYHCNHRLFNILGVIEVFDEIWDNIYSRYLSKMTFEEYLKKKKIDINTKNKKQNLLSSNKSHLGYIYLISSSVQHHNIVKNQVTEGEFIPDLNIKKNEIIQKPNFSAIYHKLIDSINNLNPNYPHDLSNETIMNKLSSNQVTGLNLYIIETSKLQYCIDTIKQLRKTINDFSNCLNEYDLISIENVNESTKYSFINEDILNYFNINITDALPKVFLFIFMKDYTMKIMLIYNPKKKNILNIINYNNNSFNIKTTKKPKPPTTDKNSTLPLENIGATCYMNATLQCLCNINSIKDYFLDDNRYNQDIIIKPNSLTKCFADVVRKLWSQTYEKYYAPREFKNKISIMNPLFQGIQANDSKDLVLFIYETIHGELNNPNQNPNQINLNNIPNELVQFRQNYYSQNYSIISKVFYYEQSNVMECQNCHYKTNNFNIMNIIIFPLEKVRQFMEKRKPNGFTVVTLNDCFEQNEEHEILSGSNQIYCNFCHQNANASSYTQLYTCPEVLTIILNRGKGLEFDVNFSFPMNLTLDKYVQDKSFDPNYELIGVLTHYGPSGMAGHFVAYCKSPINGQWFFYNDAEVTPCNSNVESEMQSNGIPYILFYQRRKINYNSNNNFEKPKCIYFTYEGKEGYFH